MNSFRPKDFFREARRDEKLGKRRSASDKYAKLLAYLVTRGNYKDALVLGKRAHRLSDHSTRLLLEIALCENFLGHADKAREWISQFVTYAARRKKLDAYREHIEKRLRDVPALRQIFYENVLQLDRTSVHWFTGLARAAVDNHDLPAAKKALVDALKVSGDDSEVAVLLMQVLEQMGQMDQVYHIKRFKEGKLAREELIVLLSEFEPSATGPIPEGTGSLKHLIGALEAELGIELEDKRDTIEPLLKEFRAQAEPVIRDSTQARLDMALAYREMGLQDIAKEEIQKIPSSDLLYVSAQALLADILFEEGSDLAALEVLKFCMRDPGADADVRRECQYKLIHVYLRLGDLKQAWILSREMIREESNYRDLRQLHKQIEARLHLEKEPSGRKIA